MLKRLFSVFLLVSLTLVASATRADEYQETIDAFKKAVESKVFFDNAYGYAVFPTIGKGGIGIGRAYEKGKYWTVMTSDRRSGAR
jgi:hypothetical protein